MSLEKFTQKWKTNLGQGLMVGFLGLFMLFTTSQASAQCELVCNVDVQISLDDDCQVTVTPEMILKGQDPSCTSYRVVIKDLNGFVIPGSPVVNGQYVGKTLQVGVYNGPEDTDNNCWGYIHIEDKIRPSIVCPDTMYVECYAAAANFPFPSAIDNCDNSADVVELSDNTVNLDCNDDYSAKRTIVYQATDASGNVSDVCYRVIYYTRVNLSDLTWPVNYDDTAFPDSTSLTCNDGTTYPAWDLNENGYPDPEETGVPISADGADTYPNNILCELNVVYSDDVLDICANSFKVLRQWTVMDWCTGGIEQRFQIIKVMDKDGPVLTAVPDIFEAYTHPYTCTASFNVPAPIVIFDCDSDLSYTVSYKVGDGSGEAPAGAVFTTENITGEDDEDGYTIHGLPGGVQVWIRYSVTDDCGNTTLGATEVLIIDNTPPVAVCDQFTVATLTNTGFAYVEAASFDDGSHDNCSEVVLKVRRMNSGCGNRDEAPFSQTSFGDYVIFCCTDIGNDDLMVELQVTDASGNENSCMVNVTIQDKLKPTITCPPNIEIDCTDDYTDLTLTGTATGDDNCGNPAITHTDSGDLGNCGVGTITRTWKATDADGESVSCNQYIYVENNNPFTGAISWPGNEDLDGCMSVDTEPSNTGEPTYNDNACSLIAHTYEDQVFTFVDDACFKILRHWTVIDWCVYEETNGQSGIWGPHTQIIKVFDNDAPELGDCAPAEFCIYESSDTKCGGQVSGLIQTATDDCSGEDDDLTWSYVVEHDLDGNGTFGFLDNGNSRNANGYYETGDYRIKWSVEDNCGNFTNCTQYFEVKDCKKPTPYCIGEVTTVVMNNSGTVEIWASDFDLGSYDNCPGELEFSFSGTSIVSAKEYGCDQLGLNSVQMWVWDAAGNKDFCEVILNIQDHSDACGTQGSSVNIAGKIVTENNQPMNNIPVSVIEGNENAPVVHMTNDAGEYTFSNMTMNENYMISAEGADDYMNGVSTLDLLLIQRHILKLKEFTSPYKTIAADVDGNETINAKDLIDLRKLILGKYDELPGNDSWRFVTSNQAFNDAANPFPFIEEINLVNLEISNHTNNFVSVKIGDVNSDVEMNADESNASASRNTMNFDAQDVIFEAGDLVELKLTASQLNSLKGFQFTMDFNTSVLEYNSVVGNAINIADHNMGTTLEDRGQVSVSWSDINMGTVTKGQELFTVLFNAKSAGTLSTALDLNSKTTNAEGYDADLETYNLSLNFGQIQTVVSHSFELMQNEPNPFVENTMVRFVLPTATTATLKVFDVTGKQLVRMSDTFVKGMNHFDISKSQLNASGVLYYQIEAGQYTATKKMVIINK